MPLGAAPCSFAVAAALALAACGAADPARRAPESPSSSSSAPPRGHARVVVFAGDPVAIDGVTLSGVDLGAVAPVSGRYRVVERAGRARVISLEIVARPAAGDRFVSVTGDDADTGTRVRPYRTIQRALDRVAPGTTIFVHGGRYPEDVTMRAVRGEPGRPIVIRSVPGERAILDGAQAVASWTRATDPEAAPDEWVSREALARVGKEATSRGAFVDRVPFTRLLTYARLEDLRAANQRWAMNDPALPGGVTPKGPRFAWVYFGPGIWHDPVSGRLHLRLAPTTNGVPGVEDWAGPTDPAEVRIAVWPRSSTPLRIAASAHVELRDLTIVGGGDTTVAVERSEHVTFDHVEIHAATMGLTIGASTAVRFLHGRIDGGIPPWSFRSDFKANYKLALADGTVAENNLVRKTSRALIYVAGGTRELEIAYSELENAHDVYLAGIRSSLHHCLIRNIHDEALYLNYVKDVDDLRIHDNVFERVLSGVSGGGQPSGARYIYRNIFDLRDPTAGFRPGASPKGTWRWGHLFKGAVGSAPFYFYGNTVAVRSAKPGQPALLHYHVFGTAAPQWFVNNVVVVVGPDAGPFAFVPDASVRARRDAAGRPLLYSDGNAWIRATASKAPLFRCITPVKSVPCETSRWASLDAVRTTGFEAQSKVAATARFARLRSLDAASAGDDLRPAAGSIAVGTAIALPPELPDSVAARRRVAGALAADSPPLEVGIDGRWAY